MKHTDIELNQLAQEFKSTRKSGLRRFPDKVWKQAISLSKEFSIDAVSFAIKVPVGYLQKKTKDLGLNSKPMRKANSS